MNRIVKASIASNGACDLLNVPDSELFPVNEDYGGEGNGSGTYTYMDGEAKGMCETDYLSRNGVNLGGDYALCFGCGDGSGPNIDTPSNSPAAHCECAGLADGAGSVLKEWRRGWH